MTAVFITHRALPGQRDAVAQVWQEHLRPAIDANPGHVAYFYCFDDADPDVIRVFQHYRDGASARAFLVGDWYESYLEAVEPFLTGEPEVHLATSQWVKGHNPPVGGSMGAH